MKGVYVNHMQSIVMKYNTDSRYAHVSEVLVCTMKK